MSVTRGRKACGYGLGSGFAYYVPGPGGAAALVLWLLVGSAFASLVTGLLTAFCGQDAMAPYVMLVSYPLMFVPPVMYALYKSRRNMASGQGYRLDNGHFGSHGAWVCSLLAVLATFAAGFMCDALNSIMPEMPEQLAKMLESMTAEGSLLVNFICVSLFAPLCEEWLCRGMILRGLLNWRRADGSHGMKAHWAILISAAVFGFIHLNPWQALPAVVLGCVMGYVYWRTGSLKLTMLMHCFNNTLALALSRVDALSGAEYWTDILGTRMYWVLFAALLLLFVLIVRAFRRIPLASGRGGCDEVGA